jgi:hypothetical protein
MNGKITRVEVQKVIIAESRPFIEASVDYIVRYDDEYDFVEISVHVRLSKQDYTINELRQEALKKANESLSLLHTSNYEMIE